MVAAYIIAAVVTWVAGAIACLAIVAALIDSGVLHSANRNSKGETIPTEDMFFFILFWPVSWFFVGLYYLVYWIGKWAKSPPKKQREVHVYVTEDEEHQYRRVE